MERLEKLLDHEAIKAFMTITNKWNLQEEEKIQIFGGDYCAALIRSIVEIEPVLTKKQFRKTSFIVSLDRLLDKKQVTDLCKAEWLRSTETKRYFKGITALEVLTVNDEYGEHLLEKYLG